MPPTQLPACDRCTQLIQSSFCPAWSHLAVAVSLSPDVLHQLGEDLSGDGEERGSRVDDSLAALATPPAALPTDGEAAEGEDKALVKCAPTCCRMNAGQEHEK